VSRAVDFRKAHPDIQSRFHDVAFKRFMAQPDETLAAIFAHCGMDYTPEARGGDARLSRRAPARQTRHAQLRSGALRTDGRNDPRAVFRLCRGLWRTALRRGTGWISRNSAEA
jgi:hypothetical protein